MTERKGACTRWTKEELEILRKAWMRGMIAKSISAMVLKHRTPGAIQRAMHLKGMKFNGNIDWKPQPSIVIGVPVEMHEHLKSLAAAQGVTVRRLCRGIIQGEIGKRDVRAGLCERCQRDKERNREWMREWRSRQRQKTSAE